MSEPPVRPVGQPRRTPRRPTVMMIVIYFVGAALLTSLAAMSLLAVQEKAIPDPLSAVGGSALTGLVALLAKRDADA